MPDRLASTPGVLCFRDIEVDVRTGTVRRNGQHITLSDQPLQLLTALLERPGDLVTRDELRRKLWPADTYVDFEHGLNAAVKRLRDALGDSADTPTYIETVPRRGYRFLGSTVEAAPPPIAPEPLHVESEAQSPKVPSAADRRRWPMLVGLVAAAGAVGLWWVASSSSRATRESAGVRSGQRVLTRLTFDSGLQTDVSWSPDGSRIAYSSDKRGNLDIWVQAVTGGEPIPIGVSDAADSEPIWSPNDDQIVFRSERDGGGLFLVSASGGPARRLTSFGRHAAWGPDGREVLFTTGEIGGSHRKLYAVVPDGVARPRELLAEFLSGGLWYWIGARPDGRVTAVGHHPKDGFGFFTVDRQGRDVRVDRTPSTLMADFGLDEPHPTLRGQWNRAGTTLFLEVTPNELSTIWRVPVRDDRLDWAAAERLTTGPENAATFSVSPDGRRVAFTSARHNTRAWIFPFDPVAGRLSGAGRPITDEEITIRDLSLVPPAGRSVLYTALRAGRHDSDVVLTDVDSGTTTVVVPNAKAAVASPTGESFTYMLVRPRAQGDGSASAAAADLEYALALRDRTGSEQLLSQWAPDQLMAVSDWAADGRALLGTFWKPFPAGPAAIAVWPVSASARRAPERILLARSGLRFWQTMYSPDGRLISFVVENMSQPGHVEVGVMNVTRDSQGRWNRIAADHEWPDKPRWGPDGRTLFFISRKPAGYFNVWGVRIDPKRGEPVGTPFQITQFNSPELAINPDMDASETDIRGDRLALTMSRVTGSIWALSDVDR